MRCNKKSKLEEEIKIINMFPYNVLSDEYGRYIVYCNSKNHRMVLDTDKNCVEGCKYLEKFYSEKKNEEPENLIKHNEIVEELEERFKELGMFISKYKVYKMKSEKGFSSNYQMGEIDIYAMDFRKNILIAVEVKENPCEENDRKAHMQLKKDLIYLRNLHPGFKFKAMYAYGEPNHRRGYNLESYETKM